MLMVMAQDKREQIRTQLIQKSQSQGVVTYDDILALLPEAERDIGLLDEVMEQLMDAGVEVVASTQMDVHLPDDLDHPPQDEIMMEMDEDLDFVVGDVANDLTADAGYQQALDTDDVVGLYLKEAGRVPLLTAEEEVSLAKRMESAELATEQLEELGEDLPMDDVYTLRELIADGEVAQEHLIRANARLV